MKKVPTILVVSLFMVGIALAAPIIDMYELTEDDCRVCHDSALVLRNTNHDTLHESGADCSTCHEGTSRKLDCMTSECHGDPEVGEGVTNHHDFEAMSVYDCFTCHEKGVPRGE